MDFVVGSDSVLFTSRRNESVRSMPSFYTVSIQGGTPSLVQEALGRWAAWAPDGKTLAFVRGGSRWTRRNFRGSANREIWLHEHGGEYQRLTQFDGDDDRPSWVDSTTIAFLSARAGDKNIFLLDVGTGNMRQLTSHSGSDVRFPRASANGSVIVYEFEDGMWLIPASGGEPTRLSIDVPQDLLQNPIERRVDKKGARELAISPDGTLVAVIVHGNIFVTQVMSKDDQDIAPSRTRQVTETIEREKDISWAPDGSKLLFSSDRGGKWDLFTVQPGNGEPSWIDALEWEVEQLTDSPDDAQFGAYSPEGEEIAFVRGRGTLVVTDQDGNRERELVSNWYMSQFMWSPDGQWLAYSSPDAAYNYDVWIVSSEGGTPYNVSRHPDGDASPRWSPDGKRLYWLSERHRDAADIWGVWLSQRDQERTAEEWLRYWNEAESDQDSEGDEEQTLVIEFEDLWRRSEPITDLRGDEDHLLVSPDSKKILFTAEKDDERDLYSVRWDGEDLMRLTTGNEKPTSVQFGSDGKAVFYLSSDGVVKRVGLDGKQGDPIPFSAEYYVDLETERSYVFDEGWRWLERWFYDDEFHGIDWERQREKYKPWALAASHDADFSDVANLMLGELNASHLSYRGKRGENEVETGWIGAFYDPSAWGPGILIRDVLFESPASRIDVGLKAGERILSVNGTPVDPKANVYALWSGTVGKIVWLEIQGLDGAKRRCALTPITYAAQRNLRYRQWVREREALVEQLSDGRLGYLHIQDMHMPAFEEMERDLYAAGHDKEGLIIDVRSNGGGWTTDYVMAVLNVDRHAYALPRGVDRDVRAYPQLRLPFAAWTKPALTLCNEESYSNAEIFAHAFKILDRGLLVGNQTAGAVISTGRRDLLNGGSIRVPVRGWYSADTGINLENNGATPDIVVEQPPAQDMVKDHDAQLERAVEEFLAVIEHDPRYGMW
jgi:tricorn protease